MWSMLIVHQLTRKYQANLWSSFTNIWGKENNFVTKVVIKSSYPAPLADCPNDGFLVAAAFTPPPFQTALSQAKLGSMRPNLASKPTRTNSRKVLWCFFFGWKSAVRLCYGLMAARWRVIGRHCWHNDRNMMAVAVLKMESGKQFEEVTVDVLANDAVGFDHREGIIINREPPDITLYRAPDTTKQIARGRKSAS